MRCEKKHIIINHVLKEQIVCSDDGDTIETSSFGLPPELYRDSWQDIRLED